MRIPLAAALVLAAGTSTAAQQRDEAPLELTRITTPIVIDAEMSDECSPCGFSAARGWWAGSARGTWAR